MLIKGKRSGKFIFFIFSFLIIIFFFAGKVEAQELRVIPRAEWGADERLRFNGAGANKWPEEYAPVTKFIIHHTGTTLKDIDKNGVVDQGDYKATIKSIYNWHAQVLNWGDIGYNYLIDPLGNIYEGRYGGDGVVGGHALDDIKNVGYNRGSVGVVILGTYGGWVYEKEQGEYLKKPDLYPTINGIQRIDREEQYNGKWRVWVDGNISPQSKESLINLIAIKAKKFDFSPNGHSDFIDLINIPNVVGHRDVDRTICPGENLYLALSETKQLAQSKFDQLVQAVAVNKIFAGSLQGQSDQEITLRANETKDVWLEFKNEGNTTWENFGSDEIYLASSEKKDQMLGKEITQEPEIIKLSQIVPVGEKIKFSFTLKPPATGIRIEKAYQLFWGNKAWLPNTETKINLRIIREDYAVDKSFSNLPEKVWANAIISVQLKLKNIGLKPWPKDKIILKIFDKGYKPSVFKNFDWKNKYGEFKPTISKDIQPEEEAIFNFNLKAPGSPLLFKNIFRLEIKGVTKIYGADFEQLIKVEPTFKAGLLNQTLPETMINGQTYSVMLKLKNTGKEKWDKNLSLKMYTEKNQLSPFYHSSWHSSSLIEKLDGKIEPDKELAFIFKLKAPQKAGDYKIKIILTQGSNKVYINEDSQLLLTVKVNKK